MIFRKAERIFAGPSDPANLYVRFTQAFRLAKLPERPVLLIRADNRYSASLGGRWIPAQQYSDHPRRPVYDEIALDRSYFSLGENCFSVLAYCQNEEGSFIYTKGEPSLIYEIRDGEQILLASGEQTEADLATGFTVGAVEKISPQLSYSFRYSAAAAKASEPAPVRILPPLSVEYSPRPIPQLTVGEPMPVKVVEAGSFLSSGDESPALRAQNARLLPDPAPVSLPHVFTAAEGSDGVYLLVDLGRETVGYLSLELRTPGAAVVDVAFGEHLADGRIRSYIDGRNFACTLRTDGEPLSFFWPIKRFGCRYLAAFIHARSAEVRRLSLREVSYPVDLLPPPAGLSDLQKRIYDTAVHTLRCCMHEHYEDCPWREQALYAMDSRNQMLFGYLAFGEVRQPRASLRLLAQSVREDGLLEICSPAKSKTNIPSFSLIFITALSEYFDMTGDRETLAEIFPQVVSILSFFRAKKDGGLVRNPEGYWNFYEWAPGLDGCEASKREGEFDSPLNAFYALAERAAEKLSLALGDSEQAALCRAAYQGVKEAFAPAFYDSGRRAFRLSLAEGAKDAYPALAQILALSAGLCDDREARRLLSDLAAEKFSPDVTLSHRIYLYELLIRDGGYRAWLLSDVERRFAPMLEAGATTFWETEAGERDFHFAGSLCHGWSAAPVYVYRKLFD